MLATVILRPATGGAGTTVGMPAHPIRRGLTLSLLAAVALGRAWFGVLLVVSASAMIAAQLLEASEELALYQPPELDILAFWPRPGSPSCAAVDAASAALLRAAMDDPSPVYLSTLRLAADRLRRRDPTLAADTDQARVLRSVLMKPEHEAYVGTLHREVLRIAVGLPA